MQYYQSTFQYVSKLLFYVRRYSSTLGIFQFVYQTLNLLFDYLFLPISFFGKAFLKVWFWCFLNLMLVRRLRWAYLCNNVLVLNPECVTLADKPSANYKIILTAIIIVLLIRLASVPSFIILLNFTYFDPSTRTYHFKNVLFFIKSIKLWQWRVFFCFILLTFIYWKLSTV